MIMNAQDDDRKRVERSIIAANSLASEDRSVWLEKIYKQAVSLMPLSEVSLRFNSLYLNTFFVLTYNNISSDME